MQKIKKRIILLLFSCFPSLLYSQLAAHDFYNFDPQGIIQKQIMNLIHVRYGSEFNFVGYTLIDSLLSHYGSDKKKKYQDPYNTLKGCIVFSTYKSQEVNEPDAFIVGVIRDGKIIWDNAPGAHANLGERLLYIQDINNDGEVDLLFLECDVEVLLNTRDAPLLYYIYMFSWDGDKGRFLNQFSEEGKSMLLSTDYFDLVDIDGDGIKEIEASIPQELNIDFSKYQSDIFPRIIYSWNGNQYGFWPRVKQKK